MLKKGFYFPLFLTGIDPKVYKQRQEEPLVISMYTKSKITEISMEIDQCMCCAVIID